ncbi:MAG: ROK family protein [Lentisphaerota bacterium]
MNLIGIDLGGTKTAVCLGDETGRILASRRIPTQTADGPRVCLQRVVSLAHDLLSENNLLLSHFKAVGISAPGPVSLRRQMMLSPPNMQGWKDVPLVRMIEDALGLPTFMNNDANACVLAEFMFGSCRGAQNMVYLTMSTGLGAGFIINGKLVQGATDTAGEIGHHVLDIHGPPCPCGQHGCLEIYCGGLNVANRLREKIAQQQVKTAILDLAGGVPERIDFKTFVAAVKVKDPFALEAWNEYIERLAQGIGTVIMFNNPEVIILGTIAIHAGDLLLQPLKQALPKYAWMPGLEICRILPSALGTRIGELSSLAVAMEGAGGRK